MDIGKRRIMKALKEKVQALIDKYTSEFSQRGLKIVLSKRYFETAVGERGSSTGAGGIFNVIFDSVDRARDHKEEKEKGYNYASTAC